jgi:NAD(P)-dependent dehydrogenase (short-subunit alcohol dehydrogenase family)
MAGNLTSPNMLTSTTPIVVVTGANTGIGFETVRALVSGSEPYTVILCSRSIEKGQAAAETLKSEIKQGSQIVPLQLDIEDDTSIERFVRDVEHHFGRVDILINNAGM